MKTYSTYMLEFNMCSYNKGRINYFSTLSRDLFFAKAIAEYVEDLETPLSVFEIGPGDGTFFKNFTSLVKIKSYIGIDISRENASKLKNELASPVIGEMGYLPIKPESQELGIALETLDDAPVEILRRTSNGIEIKVIDGGKESFVPISNLENGREIIELLGKAGVEVKGEEIVQVGLIKTISEVNRVLAPGGIFIATDWLYGRDLVFKHPCFSLEKGTLTSRVSIDIIKKLSKEYGLNLEFELLRNYLKKTRIGQKKGILFESDNSMNFVPEMEISPNCPFESKPYYEWFSEEDFHLLVLKKT